MQAASRYWRQIPENARVIIVTVAATTLLLSLFLLQDSVKREQWAVADASYNATRGAMETASVTRWPWVAPTVPRTPIVERWTEMEWQGQLRSTREAKRQRVLMEILEDSGE